MGVPKFYRWISERYPCLSEIVREYQIPEFDNLYLDMNGIIHNCSHPNDEDPHFRITEEKIFADIFHYIEILFKMIKPRKVFFMAVDGVAPRAKMNQQRGRRFRSAREAEVAEQRAVERGETLPTEARFDSNCITPGTVFMAKLHEQLKYFVTKKVSSDPIWQGIRIYLSGHETPGEGEHKIMDFIRFEKSKLHYNPNTRHCLYGLDADLIMLGLCTHEPHFSLLREEVRFGGKKNQNKITAPEETTFHLLHLSLMREYIEHEFSALKSKLKFPYNLECIIDDWVLMGFLVGNDFIPHLPHMHIAHDALPMLYKTYIDVLPSLDGYINEGGYLNLVRFEKYLEKVSQHDYEKFNDTYADLKWFAGKNANKISHWKNRENKTPEKKKKPYLSDSMFDVLASIGDQEFPEGSDYDTSPIENKDEVVHAEDSSDDDEEDDEVDEIDTEEDLFQMEFRQHKRDYYMNKLDYANVTPDVLADQTECYIRAIQWNLHYYYNGVCSWSWYYPHHYAPYISDVKGFSKQKLEFDLGKPFLPFQQLLAVLPSASKKLLPEPFQLLMFEEDSPVIDFYPVDFKTDLNGKQQDWEAVVLIPFINEKRLLEAMAPLESRLNLDEKRRNRHGPCCLYTYTPELQGIYESTLPGSFPDIIHNHAHCECINLDGFFVKPSNLKKGLCKNAITDIYFLGFPTMKHITHKATMKKANIKVFQMQSRKESMVLQVIASPNLKDLDDIAKEYLGQTVYVNWPHLSEAKVVEISDYSYKFTLIEDSNKKQTEFEFSKQKQSNKDSELWIQKASSVRERSYERWGIEIEEIAILLSVTTLIGKRQTCTSNGKIIMEKQYTMQPINFALQTIVKNLDVYDVVVKEAKNLDELFQPKMICFMLGYPHYGCLGEIEEVVHKRKLRVMVNLNVLPAEPDVEAAFSKKSNHIHYMKGYIAAQRLGINNLLLSRITGTFLVLHGSDKDVCNSKINIGLNLKFNKKNEEVPGYTKKTGEGWLYSTKAVDVMAEYLERFPNVFDHIVYHLDDSPVYTEEIFPGDNSAEKVRELQDWLKSQHFNKVQHQQCGTEVIDEPIVKAIEEIVDKFKETSEKETRRVKMQVRRNHLFMPKHIIGSVIPDPSATYKLYDRVIVAREDYSVPIGLKGTVTGIYQAEKELDDLYEIVFDEEFVGGFALRCSANRGYRLPCFALINISHGLRQEKARCDKKKPMAVVHPQAAWSSDAISLPETIVVNNTNNKTIASRNHEKSATRYFSRQNSGNGSQNTAQTNKLNHSPLSPFVPRQTTPKQRINLSSSFTHPNQPQGKKEVNNPADNEFVSLWKELKTGAEVNVQQGHRPMEFDLMNSSYPRWNSRPPEAAHILQRPVFNQPNVAIPTATCHSSNTSDEFSSMLKALSESNQSEKNSNKDKSAKKRKSSSFDHNNYDVAGTTKLLELLNITKNDDNDDDDDDDHKDHNNDPISAKQGEFKINVRRRESRSAAANWQEALSKVSTVPQPVKQNYTATWELMKLVQKIYAGAVPVYTYMTSGPKQWKLAQVRLPDTLSFCGHSCLTNEEAGESAALQALSYLKERIETTEKMASVVASNAWPISSNPFRPQLPPAFPNAQPPFYPKNVPRLAAPATWLHTPCVGNIWWNTGGEILPTQTLTAADFNAKLNRPRPDQKRHQAVNRNANELEHPAKGLDASSTPNSAGVFITPCMKQRETLDERQQSAWGFSGNGAQVFNTPFVPMQVMKQNFSMVQRVQQKPDADKHESDGNKSLTSAQADAQSSHLTANSPNQSADGKKKKKKKKGSRLAINFNNMM